MGYRVMVDDNFHYMDEDERYCAGEYETAQEALDRCRQLVMDDLYHNHKPGQTAEELYKVYTSFGEDPFIVAVDGADKVDFSAWDYAREQAELLCRDGTFATCEGFGDTDRVN